ncbi:MAG: inositol monophosphatase family protein [Acidimicrobiales bacterium]
MTTHHSGPPPPLRPPGGLLDELSEVALEAARAAAAILRDGYGGRRDYVETKSSATDMVSEVDRAAEAQVTSVLAARRPGDAVLGEEGASRPGTTGVRWVVDPLDGTTNYLFGIPAWSVSVAAEWSGRSVVGVVIDPCRDEEWWAAAGRGATCNGEACAVAAGRSCLATALVGTGFSYQRARRAWAGRMLARVLPEVRDIRRFGSAALDLSWVAGGRLDGYFEWGLGPWDLAAGQVICEEAGAVVTVHAGGMVVAAPPVLHGPLRSLVEAAGGFDEPVDDVSDSRCS